METRKPHQTKYSTLPLDYVKMVREVFSTNFHASLEKLAKAVPGKPPRFDVSALSEAARTLKLTVIPVDVATPDALDKGFAAIKQHRVDAMILGSSPFFVTHRQKIIDFAASQRLPTVYWWRPFTASGGLLSYGSDWVDLLRRAATYVDKILKGAKPGDLPIEQPTKFELIINLKTAKALGLTIPQSLLQRADEMIQ